MSKVIAGMTISVDGFVNDQMGSLTPLYSDFADLQQSEPMQEAIRDTGAVVMGRKTFALAEEPDSYADDYEFQAPIFVLTHHIPEKHPKQNERLSFTFVTAGVESAIAQAKAAAGSKDVTVIGGPSTIRQCLQAGLVDELEIDVMPILLGGGLRLFEDMGLDPMQLERVRVVALPTGRTHFKFRVINLTHESKDI